jgi:hypothetical protein
MKKLFLLFTGFIFSLTIIAQANNSKNGKGKDKSKDINSAKQESIEQKEKEAKEKKMQNEHSKKIWDGTSDKGGKGPMLSKNQPAKVRAAFQRDYPNAGNVNWYKYRGDWTASFGNGLFMSTAVYHANGERRDTRTPVTRNELPRNVLDEIFKRRPETRLDDIIKIEVPNVVTDIFRIKDIIQGKASFFYYNSDGQLVKYNY